MHTIEKEQLQENVDFLCGGRVSRARLQSPHHYVLAGPSARAVPAEKKLASQFLCDE